MLDPRLTLPESPELLARAEAVARQRYKDWYNLDLSHGQWDLLWPTEQQTYVAAVAIELRDLTRPASYDAAVRWLVEMIGDEGPGWWLMRSPSGAWFLCHEMDPAVDRRLSIVPDTITDPREALVLALIAALEARRG